MAANTKVAVLIPAAGMGSRMRADIPKQYLPLKGRPLLWHTLERLQSFVATERVVLALSPADQHFQQLNIGRLETVIGGQTRAESVLALLESLSDCDDLTWVMVHDAARPCVRHADLAKLLQSVLLSGVSGGILATRVRDTVKRANGYHHILDTVPRESLWLAATPQLFQLGDLREAMRAAIEAGAAVTDEASAMERAGHDVVLVEGHDDNIKVTRPGDLALAAAILESQGQESVA